MIRLLVDIGNSRVKSAWQCDAVLQRGTASPHGGRPLSVLSALEAPHGAPDEVWIAHVVQREDEMGIAALVQARWGCNVRYARAEREHPGGVHSAYAEPARLGVDRWLALIAAWQLERSAALVVDAGTALTVDRLDAGGLHRGGIIAPGLLGAQRAVLGSTRFAARPAEVGAPLARGLGRDTEACVAQGALYAGLGAIEAIERDTPRGRRLMTGGDGAALVALLGGDWEYRPDLVLEGLAAYADAAASADG